MKLKNHLLNGVCLGILGTEVAFGAYSGTDPEIEELKEDVKQLKAEITEMQEKDKSFEQRAESLEEELKKQPPDASEQIEKLEEKIKNLETSVEDFTKKQSEDKANKEETADAKELDEVKQAILMLHEGLEAQEKMNEQRNLEVAQQAAEIDKLKKQNSAHSKSNTLSGLISNVAKTGLNVLSSTLNGNNASDLFGSVLQGGLNILSQKLNPNYVREKINSRQPVDEITKDMTQEEKKEFTNIAEGIMKGQSNHEIQTKMNTLKEKIANRSTKEAISEIEKSKFQKLSFFGLNKAFASATLGETVTKIYDLSDGASEPPQAQEILPGTVNTIDQEVIDAIYAMVLQGATLSNIFDCISFHTEGAPMKVERKDKPKGDMINSLIKMVSTNNSDAQASGDVSNTQQQGTLPASNNVNTNNDNTQQQGNVITKKDNAQQQGTLPTSDNMNTHKDNIQQQETLPTSDNMNTNKDNAQQQGTLPTSDNMNTHKDNIQQQGNVITNKDNTQQQGTLPTSDNMNTHKDNIQQQGNVITNKDNAQQQETLPTSDNANTDKNNAHQQGNVITNKNNAQQQGTLPTTDNANTNKDNTQQQETLPTSDNANTNKDNTQQQGTLPTSDNANTDKDNTQQQETLPTSDNMNTNKNNIQKQGTLPTSDNVNTDKNNAQQQGNVITNKANTQQQETLPMSDNMNTHKDNTQQQGTLPASDNANTNKETISQSSQSNVAPGDTGTSRTQNQQRGKATPVAHESKPQARELDESSMTLMDIADNAYYDVNRHKFMKIATTSKTYPRLLTVRPLDTKSAELLKRNMKTAG